MRYESRGAVTSINKNQRISAWQQGEVCLVPQRISMKKVAIIFTWIGMGLTVLFYAVMMIVGLGMNNKENLVFVLYLIPIILSSISCFIATKSLNDDDKKTWVGVLSALLCGFVGGILYLTWTPTEPKVKKKMPLVEESMNRPSIPDQILELKDLKDIGAISPEEYEARCQSLLKKRGSDEQTQKETAG